MFASKYLSRLALGKIKQRNLTDDICAVQRRLPWNSLDVHWYIFKGNNISEKLK